MALCFTQRVLSEKLNIKENVIWKIENGFFKSKFHSYQKIKGFFKSVARDKFYELEKKVISGIKNKNNFELSQLIRAKKYPFIITLLALLVHYAKQLSRPLVSLPASRALFFRKTTSRSRATHYSRSPYNQPHQDSRQYCQTR